MIFQYVFKLFFIVMFGLCVKSTVGNSSTCVPTITEYFPELKNDLTKVVWAHAVNSRTLLEKALNDPDVMMLEADVVLGTLNGQDEIIPIMAHPPSNISDLSLQLFLETVINANKYKRKGMKLDFKTDESFYRSWSVIDPLKKKVGFPIFLNADIVPGPINGETKCVDPQFFLNISTAKFPESVLSVGWTTKYGPNISGNYSEKQLYDMKTVIEQNRVNQSITFCLRAGLAAETLGIKNFIENIDRYQQGNTTSVTIWMSSDSDPVDINKLRNLILELGKSKVFLDVPEFIHNALSLDTVSSI